MSKTSALKIDQAKTHSFYTQEVIYPIANINSHIVAYHNPAALTSEQYRSAFARLQASENPPFHMVIASSANNEGRSTALLNLAVTIARETEKRVLVVDCDFRHPTLHEFLNLPMQKGILDIVSGNAIAQHAIQKTIIPNVFLLSAGTIPSNLFGIFSSKEFKMTLEMLKRQFDYMLIDSSPIWHYPDAGMIGQMMDGVIIVIRAETTHRETVEMAKVKLETLNAKILGCILTQHKHHLPSFLYRFLQ